MRKEDCKQGVRVRYIKKHKDSQIVCADIRATGIIYALTAGDPEIHVLWDQEDDFKWTEEDMEDLELDDGDIDYDYCYPEELEPEVMKLNSDGNYW